MRSSCWETNLHMPRFGQCDFFNSHFCSFLLPDSPPAAAIVKKSSPQGSGQSSYLSWQPAQRIHAGQTKQGWHAITTALAFKNLPFFEKGPFGVADFQSSNPAKDHVALAQSTVHRLPGHDCVLRHALS